MTATRILGLDPGLNLTGYAVLERGPAGPVVREAGVVRGAEGRSTAGMEVRLRILYDGIVEVIDQYRPTVMCVEQLYAHYEHPRTAILMGHARGALILAGAQRGLTLFSYSATQVKKAVTGHGRASKEQMQHAVARELRLPAVPEPPDVADALAIALCHYHLMKLPQDEGKRA